MANDTLSNIGIGATIYRDMEIGQYQPGREGVGERPNCYRPLCIAWDMSRNNFSLPTVKYYEPAVNQLGSARAGEPVRRAAHSRFLCTKISESA